MNIDNHRIPQNISVKEIDSKPQIIFNYLNADWIKEERWFVDKDAEIISITCEDCFIFETQSYLIIVNGIILIDLKNASGRVYTKRYFIPIILSDRIPETQNGNQVLEVCFADGKRYLFSAEHHHAYQHALIKHFQRGKVIYTHNGGEVNFALEGETLSKLNILSLEVKPLTVSTSNVLTYVQSDDHSFISKTYKDMRGNIKDTDKIWPINLEAERYKVLMESGYTNTAIVHGIAYYVNSYGYKMPICMLMDYVPNDGELGGIFWTLLTEKLENPNLNSDTILNCIEALCRKISCSLARMHISFSLSDNDQFKAVPMIAQDVDKLGTMAVEGIQKNINTLKPKEDGYIVLPELVRKLEESLCDFKESNFFDNLHLVFEKAMKIQVHGDLSTAQALVCHRNDTTIMSMFLKLIESLNEKEIENTLERLVQDIRWVDFEGEPAKDMVEKNYDSRQNALRDVASLIQGFWYALNVKVYMYLGFDAQKNPQHRDILRQISLVLSENVSIHESDVEGLSQELVDFIKQCFTSIKGSVIDGYFDEIKRQGKENLILSYWDIKNAETIIDYFILLRAVHELGYESYARDWGWEAIPGGMIIQIIKKMTQFSDGMDLPGVGLRVVPERSIRKNKGFQPVYAGIAQSGLFIPFHHDHSKTEDPYFERYHWGIGDFASAKEGVDLISELGFNIRKILPVTWSAAFHSPYSVLSPEAFDPEYIGIPALFNMLEQNGIVIEKAKKFVKSKQKVIEQLRESKDMDHEAITNLKLRVMKLVWRDFKNCESSIIYAEFQKYRNSMSIELKDDLLYYIIKKENMKKNTDIGWDWRTWNQTIPGISERTFEALNFARNKYRRSIVFLEFVQFVLHLQWNELARYAKTRGVDFMIDVPFAPADARVWQNPGIVAMSNKSDGYQRQEVQGVPGKEETPFGQIWQFPVYNFSNTDATKYLHDVFKINLNRAKYIRCDHTLGFYQVFVFHQDIDQKITLQSLGIYELIENIREQALEEGTLSAKERAAYEVCETIKNALLNPQGNMPRLPAEVIGLLFENGNLRANGGNMLIVARKVEDTRTPHNVYWHREYMVESKVFKDEPYWDFIRLTPNRRADDKGFAQQWLFPEDGTHGPLPTDGIQAAYYRPGPAEGILTDFESFCQQEGALLGHELLGNVPDELKTSIKTKIGGMDLSPKVWGLNRESRYHPLKDDANSISMFGVADSTSITNAWLNFDKKYRLLEDFGINPENYHEHTERLTPEVHENLLKMAFVPQDVYPEIKDQCMPLISILGLIDLAGLDDTYRLNFPSTQTSWYRKLPSEVSTGELLDAVRGQSNNTNSIQIVYLAKRLIEARNKRKINTSDEVKLLGVRPNQDVQLRRIFMKSSRNTYPFIVEAYVQGSPEGVFLSLMDENDMEVYQVAMEKLEIKQDDNISGWIVCLLPSVRRIYKYKLKVLTGGNVVWSKSKFLAAVNENDDLNPLSPNYVLRDLDVSS